MAWILLLIATACFVATFFTTSFALGALCLLLSLVLVIIAAMMLLSARVGGAARNAPMLSPEELRVMQALAERQRTGATPAAANPPQNLNTAAETDSSPPSSSP